MPRWPFIRRPTDGDTKANVRSGRKDGRLSFDGGKTTADDAVSTIVSEHSAHTASTIESILEERGKRLFIVSLLENTKIFSYKHKLS